MTTITGRPLTSTDGLLAQAIASQGQAWEESLRGMTPDERRKVEETRRFERLVAAWD